MPAIEEAIEELRLSVLDHAYELLKRLDIDELTTDEIRKKLELYDITINNMSGEWLPNGRFYRLYPSIKHHRSRQNTIKSIAKSGGRFEGLWSNDYNNQSSNYNFNSIQVARHYEISSNADGYFFVSGDAQQDSNGYVTSSAVTALQTDCLINQSLPAGYTYLYIPWPRPVFPSDSRCFYNVNALAYDRLTYATDCEHQWLLYDDSEQIYHCVDNSEENRFCKIYTDTDGSEYIKYGSDAASCVNDFSSIDNDVEFFKPTYSSLCPASTKYNWNDGTNTPWRLSYWFDYHYMNTMGYIYPTNNSVGQWPITESGTYYNKDNDPVEPSKAIKYVLDDSCKELDDSKSVFPTKCYIIDRLKTSEPNRAQKFSSSHSVLMISYVWDDDRDYVVNLLHNTLHLSYSYINTALENFNNKISALSSLSTSNTIIITLCDEYTSYNGSLHIYYDLSDTSEYSMIAQFTDGVWESTVLPSGASINSVTVYGSAKFIINEDQKQTIITGLQDKICVYDFDDSFNDTIDTNVLTDYNHLYINNFDIDDNRLPGTYRWDSLYSDIVLHIRENLHHNKTYKPFWCENTPWFDMSQSNYVYYPLSDNPVEDNKATRSLYHWLNLKQNTNVPRLSLMSGENVTDYTDVICKNKPPVSEITFTSTDRPTRSMLDASYIGYTNSSYIGEVITLSNDTSDNVLYDLDGNAIKYEPNKFYTITSVGTFDSNTDEQIVNSDSLLLYLEGDPSTDNLHINLNGYSNSLCNYVVYKTSLLHKFNFSADESDVTLSDSNKLYINGNNEINYYSSSAKSLSYRIKALYDSNNVKVADDDNLSCVVFVCNNKYHTYLINHTGAQITAAYALLTSDVSRTVHEAINTPANNSITGDSVTAKYVPVIELISVDGGITFITLNEFVNEGWSFASASYIQVYNTISDNIITAEYLNFDQTISVDGGVTFITMPEFAAAGWVILSDCNYELTPVYEISDATSFYISRYIREYNIVTVDDGDSYSKVNDAYGLLTVVEVPVYNQTTNEDTTIKYVQSHEKLSFDGWESYTSLSNFYSDEWIMKKYVKSMFYEGTEIEVYYDDCTGIYPIDGSQLTSFTTNNSDTWSFD